MEEKNNYTKQEMEEALIAYRDYFLYGIVYATLYQTKGTKEKLDSYKNEFENKVPKSLINKLETK